MLRLFVSPWPRKAMSEVEWQTLRGLALDGTLVLLAKTKRGPFICRLSIDGMPGEFRGTGPTVGAAIRAVVQQVAA